MNDQRTVQIISPSSELSTEDQKIKAAAHCRVSTDFDDQENSFLAQVKYYSDYIGSREDMILVDIYADEGITGTAMSKREEFKRLLNDAKLGRIDRVFCKSVSRFARNSLECIESIRALKDCGTTVVFENDNIDTKTMNSEMVLYVKSAFAQSEALAGSARVSSAYRMKMENGTFTTYCAPFGYRLVNGNLEIIPEEAEIFRKIFNMYLSGLGINSISAKLNREAIEGDGRQWNNPAIRYILTNEKYIGDSLTQKNYTPPMLPLRCIRNKGERDKFYISNTHEAIISRNDFETVQQLLADRNNKTVQTRKRYLFSQMIICSHCGWTYRRKVQNDVVYWVCSRKRISGFDCDSPNLTEEAVKKGFVKAYNKLRTFEKEILDKTIADISELQNKRTRGNAEINQIDSEILRLSEQNSRFENFRSKGILDEISFMEQTNRLRGRLTELRNRRLKLLQNCEEESIIENLSHVKEELEENPKALIDFSEEIFRAIIEKIIVEEDGTVSYRLKGGIKLTEDITEVI